jgi:phosphatidylglycerol---prolipoprotein diacylglyceryl transferase
VNVAQIQLWSRPFEPGIYSGALITAALVVPLVAGALAASRGLSIGRVAICLFVATISTLVGARLLHWWTHPIPQGREVSRLLSLDFRDFSLYGGFLLAGLAGVVCCALARVKVWELADCVAIALGIGIVIIRVGCFANGCCFGVETELPWGVVYPQGSPAHLHQIAGDPIAMFHECRPVHPTQIYEMLAAGTAGLLAFVLVHRNLPNGVPFLAAAIVFTSARWVIDPLRAHNLTPVTTGWTYRHLYEMLVAIGTVVLVWRLRDKKNPGQAEEKMRVISKSPAPYQV